MRPKNKRTGTEQALYVSTIPARRNQAKHVAETLDRLAQLHPDKPLDASKASTLVRAVKPTCATDREHNGTILGADGVFSPMSDLEGIRPVLPDNGKAPVEYVVLMNGIMTDVDRHLGDMQALANTGAAVFGVHNATEGLVRDLYECVQDKVDMADSAPANTVARLVTTALVDNRPIRLIGHSQGAITLSNAIGRIRGALEHEGVPEAEISQLLSLITVETFGGAAYSFPDGPNYRHYVNKADVIPMLAGVGLDRFNPAGSMGARAELRQFFELNSPGGWPEASEGLAWRFARTVDKVVHGPRDVYFRYRNKTDE